MVEIVKLCLVCGTLVLISGGVLIALPQSKFRDFCMPFVAIAFAAIYVFSPLDLVPEMITGPVGLLDDGAAVVAGVIAARSAIKAAKERQHA